ncbi:MAG: hypothetical protein JST50_09450 [Bacteroidetes bacterium]|jgi:hypothetical protein|nr:hypothetical protein [Bacteroidota bacterium]
MNIKKALLLIAVLLGAVYHASAQYNPLYNNSRPLKLDVGINSGFSTGPVSDYFPEAGGISVALEVPLKHSPVSVLFSTGYTFYVSGGGYDVGYDPYYGYDYGTYYYGDIASFIPVEAGLKIFPIRRFFIEGLAGASFNVNNYSSDYTYKPTAFIYSAGGGYSFPLGFRGRNSTDLSLFYENRPEPGGGYSQVGVKATFNFALH